MIASGVAILHDFESRNESACKYETYDNFLAYCWDESVSIFLRSKVQRHDISTVACKKYSFINMFAIA